MVLISKKAVSSNRLVLYGGRWRCPPGAAFQHENLRLIYIFKFFGYGQGGHGGAKTGAYYYHIGLNIADFCKTAWNTHVTQRYLALSGVFQCEHIYQS